MRQEEARDLLTRALAAGPRRAWCALRPGLPGGTGAPGMAPAVRIVVGLRGERRCRVVGPLGDRAIALRRGDVLVAAAGVCVRTDPRSRFRALALVVEPQALRVMLAEGPRPPGDSRAFLVAAFDHGPAPDEELLAALRRLLAVGDGEDGDAATLRRYGAGWALARAHALLAAPVAAPDASRARWLAAVRYIGDHCHLDLGRRRVARAIGIHPNHLSRLCSRHGEGFAALVLGMRLDRARALLAAPDAGVSEVAAACGFTHLGWFARRFRERFGAAPSALRGKPP